MAGCNFFVIFAPSFSTIDNKLNVFHDINLHGADIRKYDLDINVDFKHFIVYRDMDLVNTKMHLVYKNQKGRVDTDLVIANGKMTVEQAVKEFGK